MNVRLPRFFFRHPYMDAFILLPICNFKLFGPFFSFLNPWSTIVQTNYNPFIIITSKHWYVFISAYSLTCCHYTIIFPYISIGLLPLYILFSRVLSRLHPYYTDEVSCKLLYLIDIASLK